MQRSTSLRRRACAIGTTIALTGLLTGVGMLSATSATAAPLVSAPAAAPTGTAAPTATATAAPSPTATAAPSAVSRAAEGHTFSSSSTAGLTDAAATTSTPTATPDATAAPSVTITGDPSVGSTITASTKNFTGSTLSFAWTVNGVATTDTGTSFDIDASMVGKAVVVTVTSEVPGESATANVTVTQKPVFVDANGAPLTHGLSEDDPIQLTTTAGAKWSYQFRATGSPTPTLKAAWFDPSEAEDADGYTPLDDFPDNTTFDPTTGIVSGAPEFAQEDDFAVSATSGDTTVTEYVALTVDPAAPLGVEVYTADKAQVDANANPSKEWIIAPDGSIYTLTVSGDDEGFGFDFEPGGQPTIKQGGTLLVGGSLVDQYGNEITDAQGDSTPVTVTSNIASDVIGYSDEDGADTVTFPHASTHRLSVAAQSYSTAFDVVVTPVAAAATVSTTNTVAGSGAVANELAYTGSESTELVPWALGLVLAGIGVTAAQTIRRRRTRR